jgi:hypothetical protein
MTSSKSSGAALAESPLDILKRTAKADIIMQLTYTVNTQGPKKYITFILQGLDAYTDNRLPVLRAADNLLSLPTFPSSSKKPYSRILITSMPSCSSTSMTF